MSEHDEREDYDDEPGKSRLRPERLVYWTAFAMFVIGVMQLAVTLLGLRVAASPLIDPTNRQDGPQWIDYEESLTMLILVFIGIVWNILVLYGSYQMRKFRRHSWAVIASIMCAIALPFVPLGVLTVPLAIWSIVLLQRPEVRGRFEAATHAQVPHS